MTKEERSKQFEQDLLEKGPTDDLKTVPLLKQAFEIGYEQAVYDTLGKIAAEVSRTLRTKKGILVEIS